MVAIQLGWVELLGQQDAALSTSQEAWELMRSEHPELESLFEVFQALDRMKLHNFPIGSDGRNRCGFRPYWTITGRNLPSPKEFVFGASRWLRWFIKPPQGYRIAYMGYV